jgi:hypothetical protein
MFLYNGIMERQLIGGQVTRDTKNEIPIALIAISIMKYTLRYLAHTVSEKKIYVYI